MPLSDANRKWFLQEIQALDPAGAIVALESGGTHLRYCDAIRSSETRHRRTDPEELVRALTIVLLCSDAYGYEPQRMYIEQTHTIGRPSASTAQVDLILFLGEEDGTESVFAMWEMKAPDEYKPASDPLIEHQLFGVAPLVSPSLLVYSTVKPRTRQIECITIDYKAHKTYAGWDAAAREST
jgi:hypothetical protein